MTTAEILMAVAALLFVPWMTWVSKQLWVINQHTVGLVQRVQDNERRIGDIERILPRHVPGVAE